MKNIILKMSTLILSLVLIVFSIIFFSSIKETIYDDSTGIRLPKNMSNVQKIMTKLPEIAYTRVSYFDDVQGKWVEKQVYADKEKIDDLFEAIDSETWYYAEIKRAVGERFSLLCYDSRNTNREFLSVDVYSDVIYVTYVELGEGVLKSKYVVPEDGESEVYEKMLAIVNDLKSLNT